MNNKRFAPELTGHNIKVIKDSDYEHLQTHVDQKALEEFKRDAYGSLAWWHQEEEDDE